MITHNFDELIRVYEASYPKSPFIETWIPRDKFESAEYDGEGNISISRDHYGLALGLNPLISESWNDFSIDSRAVENLGGTYKAFDQWDCYWSPTIEGEVPQGKRYSDAEIEAFLKLHAPHSSVFPGNSEIQEWITLEEDQQLAGVAALCRWESGRVVISSVAVDTALRGRGIGKELMRRTLIAGSIMGESSLSLGVMHSNESAQRLYRSLGFTLMHNFTYCKRR